MVIPSPVLIILASLFWLGVGAYMWRLIYKR